MFNCPSTSNIVLEWESKFWIMIKIDRELINFCVSNIKTVFFWGGHINTWYCCLTSLHYSQKYLSCSGWSVTSIPDEKWITETHVLISNLLILKISVHNCQVKIKSSHTFKATYENQQESNYWTQSALPCLNCSRRAIWELEHTGTLSREQPLVIPHWPGPWGLIPRIVTTFNFWKHPGI